jgi:hypothetical protein
MTARDIFNGSTGNRARILILDDATGKPKTGVAWNASGLSIAYKIGTGSEVAITLTSGNWSETGGGKYLVDVADSVYAAGNLGALVQFYGALTASSVYGEQHRVVAYNPLAVAVGANTTTPPTAAAVADAVWDEAYSGHTTAGTFGKLMDILRKSNTVIEGTILASPTPTTTTFRISGADYPTGALEHSVLWMSSGTSSEQNSPILTTVNNGDGTLTITLEEALVTAPIAGDTVLIDPTSHVHAIVDIVSGVWSALTSGISVVGSTGRALARLIGLVVDDGGDEFTTKALSNAPAGGGGGDASQATLLAVKAKTDLITSQTANQQQTPVNQLAIVRGDSYTGTSKLTRAVTTDYTGYTATFTIRHRVTDAVLLSVAGAVDSSTQLSVSLSTTNTAFALLVDPTEFGPHPYDFRLVSGSIEKTESGIAIIKRDVTRA